MAPDDDMRANLPDYFDIQEGSKHARFLVAKSVSTDYDRKADLKELWAAHEKGLEELRRLDLSERPTPVKDSLLDLKVIIADRILSRCQLCERRCKADRKKGKTGVCGVTDEPRISSEFLHMGEEPELVPSHTIFFSGCTFKCVYCQNWDISQSPGSGERSAPKEVADLIDRRCGRNVNWVGGDPTSNLPFILEVLRRLETNIAQVWNSNMYCSEETMKLLHGIIDIYLTDFKYGNDACAKRLSDVDNYLAVVKRNHLIASQQSEILIRHLVLPNHYECCSKPILKYIAAHVPNALVNIMAQYRPEYKVSEYKDISRPVLPEEVSRVKDYAEKLGIHQI